MTPAQLAADVRRGTIPVVPEALQMALAARDRVLELQTTQRPAESYADALRDVVQDALTTGDVPADFDERLYEAEHGRDRAQHRDTAIGLLLRRVDEEIPRIVGAHIDEMLAGLREQLGPVVNTLRATYTALAGFEDLDRPDGDRLAAADDKTREAFRTMTERTVEYLAIRRLQLDLLSMGSPVPGSTGFHTHLWSDVARQGVLELEDLTEPGLPGSDLGKRSAVRAVVSRPDVWLPTRRQLEDAWEQLFGSGEQRIAVAQPADPGMPTAPRPGELIQVGL